MPIWTPLNLNPVFALPTAYLRGMTVERLGLSTSFTYATAGSLVGRIEDPASACRIGAGSDAGRFTASAAPSGGQNAFLTGSSTSLWSGINTAKLLAFFNRNRDGEIWVRVRFAAPHAGTNNTILDCCNSTGSQVGPNLRRQSDNKIYWQIGRGDGSICNLASTQTVNASGDTAWHDIRARVSSSLGRAYLGIDDNALANATFTGNALAADCSSDIYIGMRNTSSQPLLGDFADLYIFDTPQDDAAWSKFRAFNPEQTMDCLSRELVSHPTSLRPDQVSGLFDWFSPHLAPATVWKDTGRSANATATDDPVMLIDNRKAKPTGCSHNRDAIQTTSGKAPKWRNNAGPFSLDGPFYDGAAVNPPSVDLTGERDLVIAQQPEQNFIMGVLYQQLRATDGSHVMTAGTTYGAAGGSAHTTANRRNLFAQHWINTAGGNSSSVSGTSTQGGEGVNIAIIRKVGTRALIWFSGNPNNLEIVEDVSLFQPTHIGRPSIAGWDLWGYWWEWFRNIGEHSAATAAKLYQGMIDAHGLTGFPPLPSGFLDDGPTMQTLTFQAGATSQSRDIFLRHSATKQGLTGLVWNTAGLTCYQHRAGSAAASSALATLASVTAAWSSGGFKEIDPTNKPGWYRWDIPNALIASLAETVVTFRGATDLEDTPVRLALESEAAATIAALAALDAKIGTVDDSPALSMLSTIKTYAQGTAATVSSWVNNGITLASSERIYHATIDLALDDDNARDEYTVRYFKDMIRQTSGITSPTIQIVKRADGTNLLAETALTQIGSTGAYKYDATAAARLTKGEACLVVIRATIDGSTRTMERIISRDA